MRSGNDTDNSTIVRDGFCCGGGCVIATCEGRK